MTPGPRRSLPALSAPLSRWGLLLALALAPNSLRAQAAPLVVEVHAGASIPVSSFAVGTDTGEGTTAGASFGVDFAFSGSGRRTIYAGFSQHRFGCEEAGCPEQGNYVATALEAGFRLNLLTRGSVIPWLRLGGVTLRVESPGVDGSPAGSSERGFGGDVGLGIYIGTWSIVALNPAVRFTTASVDLPGGEALRMRWVVADLGLSLAF